MKVDVHLTANVGEEAFKHFTRMAELDEEIADTLLVHFGGDWQAAFNDFVVEQIREALLMNGITTERIKH